MAYAVLPPVSRSYPPPKGMFPYVPHPSATAVLLQPFNLHVLGLPPAFVLSQDQTLIFITKAVLCTQFLKLLYFLVSLLTETLQKLTNIIYSYTLSRLYSHALDARLFRLEQPSVHLFFLPIHTLFNILAPSGA